MFLETLRQALSAILRNAMRSFLTVLGVIIGVAAVIAMVTIGQGSTAQIESDVSSLGVNLLMMRPGQGMGPASSSRTAPLFSLKDVEAIKEQVPGVLAVAPVNSSTQTVIAGNENHSATITGTDGEYLTVRSWKIVDGRGFLDAEARAGTAVCLLGQTVREELYGAAITPALCCHSRSLKTPFSATTDRRAISKGRCSTLMRSGRMRGKRSRNTTSGRPIAG